MTSSPYIPVLRWHRSTALYGIALQTERFGCDALIALSFITIHRFHFKWCLHCAPLINIPHCSYSIYFLNSTGSLSFRHLTGICFSSLFSSTVFISSLHAAALWTEKPQTRLFQQTSSESAGHFKLWFCLYLFCQPVFGLRGPRFMAKTPKACL